MHGSAAPLRLEVIDVFTDSLSVDWYFEPSFHLDIAIGEADTELDRSELHRPLYWRLDDLPRSLCSIELSRHRGQLCMVSVPVYTKPVHPLLHLDLDAATVIPGVPVFHRRLWPHVLSEAEPPQSNIGDFCDFTMGVQIELGPESLRIRLFDDTITERIVIGGSLHCELNGTRELCAVHLFGFSGRERANVERHLGDRSSPAC